MKRIIFILLILIFWLTACSRKKPSTMPTEGIVENQTERQITASSTPTQVKVAMVTVTPSPTASPTATASPTPTVTPTPTATATATPFPPQKGLVTGDQVNLRSGPDTGYAIIGEAVLSQTVQIIARDIKSEWWQICCPSEDEASAWISTEFVETTLPFTQAAKLLSVIEFPQVLSGVVARGELNLRSGPGTQYELVGELALGETVEIVGRNEENTWWQINTPAHKGDKAWVYTIYLLTNFDPADAKRRLPSIEPTPTANPTPNPTIASTLGITLSVTGVISGDLVNLRKGPGTEYDLDGRVKLGQMVLIVGRNKDNSWWQVCCYANNKTLSWINAAFVLVDTAADLSRIPVITQPPAEESSQSHNSTTNSKNPASVGAQLSALAPSNAGTAAVTEVKTENPEASSTAGQTLTLLEAPANGAAENALPAPGSFGAPGNINPLTGLPLPAKRQNQRPVVVCINNDPQARPQYGLSQADVMYEYLMEGYYITRYSGIFYGESPSQIGPIRSARLINYYLGALYNAPVFCSGASDKVRFILKNQAPFSYLDIDLDDGSNTLYTQSIGQDYRTRLRTSTAGLRSWTEDWGIEKAANLRGFSFGDLPGDGLPAAEIAIPYVKSTGSHVSYTYNPQSGRYLRFLGDQAHTDASTGMQISVENVIVQYVTHQDTDIVEDSLGSTSIRLNLFGSGKAILFRDGVALPGVWRSSSQGDTPHFIDQGGQEIPLKPGKTWISVVPGSYEIAFYPR